MMFSGRLARPVFAVFVTFLNWKSTRHHEHFNILKFLKIWEIVFLFLLWFDFTLVTELTPCSWPWCHECPHCSSSGVGLVYFLSTVPVHLSSGWGSYRGFFLGNPRIDDGYFPKSGRTTRKKKVQFILYYSINENTSIPTAGAWIHFTSGNFRWRFTKKWQFLGKLGVYWGERAAAQWLLEFWGYTHCCFSLKAYVKFYLSYLPPYGSHFEL